MVGSGNTRSARMIAVARANSPAPNQTPNVRSWRSLRIGTAISVVRAVIPVINPGPPARAMLMTAAKSAEATHKRGRAGR